MTRRRTGLDNHPRDVASAVRLGCPSVAARIQGRRTILAVILTIALWSGVAAVCLPASQGHDCTWAGGWSRSDSSVSVNAMTGCLVISPDSGYNDYAQRTVNADVPCTIEARMRLVSGGRNYRLPLLMAYSSNPAETPLELTYLADSAPGGWRLFSWTDAARCAPASEGIWVTTRVTIGATSTELRVMNGKDLLCVATANQGLTSVNRIRLQQPWDAECNVDYVRICPAVPAVNEPFDNPNLFTYTYPAWSRSRNSVRVTYSGALRIVADGRLNDYAQVLANLPTPCEVEAKARLVSGGVNYLLPLLIVSSAQPGHRQLEATYLANTSPSDHFGWRLFDWTDLHRAAPTREGTWVQFVLSVGNAATRLYVRRPSNDLIGAASTQEGLPDVGAIRLQQPWDAVCQWDFLKVTPTAPLLDEPFSSDVFTGAAPALAASDSSGIAVSALCAVPVRIGAEVTFTLNTAANVSATILNVAGRPVRHLCTARPCEAGTNRLVWNAQSDAGLRAPAGAYLVSIEGNTPDGRTSRAVKMFRLER